MSQPASGLLDLIRETVPPGTTIDTLARNKPNKIVDITDDGVLIQTEKSIADESGPQLVDAWMLDAAWQHLQTHGRLTNDHLVSSAGLNVKRSSAVCAILAHLPGVAVESTHPIVLSLDNSR